jgi:hypothetical protein
MLAASGCGEQAGADAAVEEWLAPYAAAASGYGEGWPGYEVEVSVATFQQDYRLREFVPTCTMAPTVATSDSIGPLHAGQTLAGLTAACPQQLRGWAWGAGGVSTPAAAVSLGGSIVVALIGDTLPGAVIGQVVTGEVATTEGFGAGSPIEDLIDGLGRAELIAADCTVELKFASRPGLSFLVEVPPGSELECADFEAIARENAVDRLPPGTLVRALIQFRES